MEYINIKYKIKKFNKLSNIFNKISNITDNIDLSWIDTANAITFIMKNNTELLFHEINNNNKDNIIFIKFNNIPQFDHAIIIHKDLLIPDEELIWSNEMINIKQIDDNVNNGYENTKIIKDKADNETINLNGYPAFKYCINIQKYYNLLDYEGYLPAINELKFLNKNIDLINYILKYVNGTILNINSDEWWSSTQYSDTCAWNLFNGQPDFGGKNYRRQVLPLFYKKIKNKL